MTRLAVALALLGVTLVVAGVALWSVPAALIVTGLSSAATAYGLAYAAGRRAP